MIVAVSLKGGRLQLSDIYGNFLIEFVTEDGAEIIEIQSNPKGAATSDDMYVAALTENGHLYVYRFELSRVENWADIKKAQKNHTVLTDETGEEILPKLVEYPYSKKYKQTLH